MFKRGNISKKIWGMSVDIVCCFLSAWVKFILTLWGGIRVFVAQPRCMKLGTGWFYQPTCARRVHTCRFPRDIQQICCSTQTGQLALTGLMLSCLGTATYIHMTHTLHTRGWRDRFTHYSYGRVRFVLEGTYIWRGRRGRRVWKRAGSRSVRAEERQGEEEGGGPPSNQLCTLQTDHQL